MMTGFKTIHNCMYVCVSLYSAFVAGRVMMTEWTLLLLHQLLHQYLPKFRRILF